MADERKRLTFDPTINAGHVLTAIAMLAAGGAAYSTLDKRLGVLEEKAMTATATALDRQQEQKEALKELRVDVKELQRTVNDISRAVAGRPGR